MKRSVSQSSAGLTRGQRWLIPVLAMTPLLLSAVPAHALVCVNPANSACEATIQDGVDAAAVGEVVKVFPGTYLENVVIATDGITLKGVSSSQVKLYAGPPDRKSVV